MKETTKNSWADDQYRNISDALGTHGSQEKVKHHDYKDGHKGPSRPSDFPPPQPYLGSVYFERKDQDRNLSYLR